MIDAATGTRKLISKKNHGAVTWSPSGRYLLSFDGKDWETISVPDGKTVNLTASLPVKFWNEETDTPSTPGAYGTAGWTKDGQSVLLYDKYDVWRVSPDGSGAKNITAGYGRQHDLRLRYIRTEAENPRERWIDGSKPVMLQAENLKTWESGFFRASPGRRRAQATGHGQQELLRPGEGQGRRRLPADRTDLQRVPRPGDHQQHLQGTAQGLERQPAEGATRVGHVRGGAVQERRRRAAERRRSTSRRTSTRKKKYPMMVYIYEKLSQNVNHFVNPAPGTSINISYYVSNGYLVLMPDIVYTIGYPGQSALKCVLPAIQAVVDKGIVDEKAIGIQGHSWGGYQIAYMVTQTNRFRAVAAGAPVVNMISAYDGIRWGTGPAAAVPVRAHAEPHRRLDLAVPDALHRELADLLGRPRADAGDDPAQRRRRRGAVVSGHRVLSWRCAGWARKSTCSTTTAQPHGLRNRADQKDYTIRLQQFFDHYLKGAPTPDWMEKGVPFLERDRTALSTLGQ